MKLKMEIIGHLGQNAKLGNKDGRAVLNFSVAHTAKFKNEKGEETEKTTWVNCAYWNDKAENLAEWMIKGSLVSAEGTPMARTYTNAAGQICASLDMNVKDLRLLSSKKDSEAGQETGEDLNINPIVDFKNRS